MPGRFDTIIKGGTIVDGRRTPRFVSDVGIKDGLIRYIGDIRDIAGAQVIDATGLIVAPGFIDLHTHYDSQIFWDPYCTISGWHGVTSVVIGNCGFGFAPCRPENRDRLMLSMSRNEAVPLASMQAGMPWDWETFPEFLDSLDRTPKGVNILTYFPIAPAMVHVMGIEAAKTRPANDAERAEMRALFEEALDAGACGFSTQYAGVEGFQRDYDGTPMVTDLMAYPDLTLFAEVLRERGEGFVQITSSPDVGEDLARISGRPVVWNTLTVGLDQHGAQSTAHEEIIDWLASANAKGLRIFGQSVVTATNFTFTMEDWNLYDQNPLWREITLGSREEKLRKMSDPEMRKKLRTDHDAKDGHVSSGTDPSSRDPEEYEAVGIIGQRLSDVFVTSVQSEKYRKYEGFTVGELAKALGKHPLDAFLDISVEDDLKTAFESSSNDIRDPNMGVMIRSPWALPGLSDGGAHTKFITNGRYPTEFLAVHVREMKVIDLEEAHWRLSAYPAYAAGLKDRGTLEEGKPADIVVYDLEALRVTPEEVLHDYPANEWRRVQKAEGYRYVLVNGHVTFEDGRETGATPGVLLRHGYAAFSRSEAMAAE